MSVASAFYKGDANNPQVQRLYGTCFKNKAGLDEHLERVEQAKQRDHRKLGRELELFKIDEQVGQGLVLWLPNGAIIRNELQRFITEQLDRQGYSQVFTPHIGKLDLSRTSGHFPYYEESPVSPDPGARRHRTFEQQRVLLRGSSQCAAIRGGERFLAEADELPAPHPDFRQQAPFLSRSPSPAGGVRNGLPLGAERRTRRNDPGALLHPGRRPSLRDARSSLTRRSTGVWNS